MISKSKVESKQKLDNRQHVKVDHPEFGHVVFSNPTARQLEVLKQYKKLYDEKERSNSKV